MRTCTALKNFSTLDCKKKIVRNLNRILDIRILDLDEDRGTITFLYENKATFEKVKRELMRIGYPINLDQTRVQET